MGNVFLTNVQSGLSAISKKKLVIPDFIRIGYGGIMALLLSCLTDRRCIKGGSD
jgi:hypothetical protein